jgi:TPR repeat protein
MVMRYGDPRLPSLSTFSQAWIPPGASWFKVICLQILGGSLGLILPVIGVELAWLLSGNLLLVGPWAMAFGGSAGLLAITFRPVLILFGEGYIASWFQLLAVIWVLGMCFILVQNLLLRILPNGPRPGLSLATRAGFTHFWPVLLFCASPTLSLVAAILCMAFHVASLYQIYSCVRWHPILSHALSLSLILGFSLRLPEDLRVELFPWLRQQDSYVDSTTLDTPRKRREHTVETARLRANPYVLSQNINYEMVRKDLPPDVKFLIAQEGANRSSDFMRWLGDCYYHGVGTKPDPIKALQWWEKAISRDGNAEAKISKGIALMEGKGLPKDESAGRDLIISVLRWAPHYRKPILDRLAPAGLAERDAAMEGELGITEVIVQHDLSQERTREKLQSLQSKISSNPNLWVYQPVVEALANRNEAPPGSPYPLPLTEAHPESFPTQQKQTGLDMPVHSPSPTHESPRFVMPMTETTLRQKAAAKDPEAMGELAIYLATSSPQNGNPENSRSLEAVEWAEKAIRLGNKNPKISRILARAYGTGEGAPLSPQKSMEYLIQADDLNSLPPAQLKTLAKQNIPGAIAQLGIFYFYGHGGLPQDQSEGIRLLLKATENGYRSYWVCETLARAYANGLGGLPKDPALAKAWRTNAGHYLK